MEPEAVSVYRRIDGPDVRLRIIWKTAHRQYEVRDPWDKGNPVTAKAIADEAELARGLIADGYFFQERR